MSTHADFLVALKGIKPLDHKGLASLRLRFVVLEQGYSPYPHA